MKLEYMKQNKARSIEEDEEDMMMMMVVGICVENCSCVFNVLKKIVFLLYCTVVPSTKGMYQFHIVSYSFT